jgi:hypothetical protein
MPNYTEEQRKQIAQEISGKTVQSLTWEPPYEEYSPGYWVMTFTDDAEISFRLMAELPG